MEPVVLVFAGDSITDADHLWDPGELGLGCGYVHGIGKWFVEKQNYCDDGCLAEMQNNCGDEKSIDQQTIEGDKKFVGKQIINSGFNGFCAIDLYRRFDRVCLSKNPDLVTLLIGVNEAGAAAEGMVTAPETFRETYVSMIEQVQAQGASMILMEPFLFSKPAYLMNWRPYFDSIRLVIHEVAKTYKLPLILLDEPLNQMAKELGPDAVTVDGIHLTELGNRYLTERWIETYLQIYG